MAARGEQNRCALGMMGEGEALAHMLEARGARAHTPRTVRLLAS